MDDAFNELAADLPEALQPILDYFKDTFVGPIRRGHRRQPRYPAAIWSVYDRVQHNLPRTNNSVEGWNSALAANTGGHHINFWRFINVLKREQALAAVTTTHALQGREPPNPRPVYAALNERVSNIVDTYGNIQRLQYIRRIAFNFTW